MLQKDEPAEPRKVSLTELSKTDYADFVLVENVELVRDKGVWAKEGDRQARLYNTFRIKNISVPSNITDKTFNVWAIYGTNTLNGETIEELYLLQSPEEYVNPEPPATIVKDIAELKTLESETLATLKLMKKAM